MSEDELHILDFRNAVEQMALPEVMKDPLLPVYEAIHNSIQSIQSSENGAGEVLVTFVRDVGDLDPKQIVAISIQDNGIGFTDENVASFGTLFTAHKKVKFNSKGIGRLAYFVSFYDVEIRSIYCKNKKFYLFNEVIRDDNFSKTNTLTAKEISSGEICTTVTLSNVSPTFLQLYKIDQDVVKNKLEQHFLPSILSTNKIKIKVIDGDQYYLDENAQDVTLGKPIVIESSVFDIYHLKNRTPRRSTHRVILSADGRAVKQQAINFLPKGKIGDNDDKYYLNTVVVSEYLDKNLNTQRTDFNIPKKKESISNGMIDLESIYDNVFESSRGFSKESIKNLQNVLDGFIEKTFDDLPHLSFLREDKSVRRNLRVGDDVQTVKDAYVKRFAEKQVESFNYVRLISKKYESNDIPNFEEFQRESLQKLDEGMKINHAPLVSYIKYRDFVLNLYGKLLERKTDGKYQQEKILHDILFPRKTESSDYRSDYFKHNLWIIDDRYAVYDFLTSDLPECNVSGGVFCQNDKRYDICAAYSDPFGEEHNVFIVELKKTSLPLSETNDPIGQIKNYVQRMINGKLTKHNGTRINISSATQFFGLVLCDLHSPYFAEYMVSSHSLKKRPDSKSYHAVMLNERLFLEVTNYENLLDIAHARNRVFIEKLNHG